MIKGGKLRVWDLKSKTVKWQISLPPKPNEFERDPEIAGFNLDSTRLIIKTGDDITVIDSDLGVQRYPLMANYLSGIT